MTTRVLIAGAGPAALETALALRHDAPGLVEVTLLAPETHFAYKPISVAEPFALGATRRYELRSIAEDLGATLVPGTLEEVDVAARRVLPRAGRDLPYDALVIAIGARPIPIPEATSFWGPDDAETLHGLVQDVEMGYTRRVAFVVPSGPCWPLPLYELAIMTAERAYDMYSSPEVHLVTPEAAPLEVFGDGPSAAVREMLEHARVTLHTGTDAVVERRAVLLGTAGERLEVDRVVALPRLAGREIAGVPHDDAGFIPVDELGLVRGLAGVYAAGDVADFPVKQGGIATQQADAVASAIAARAGADVVPRPFEPVLRGMLLTERRPQWLQGASAGPEGAVAAPHPLWWPPTKVVGRRLAPYLLDLDEHGAAGSARHGLPIEVRLARASDA